MSLLSLGRSLSSYLFKNLDAFATLFSMKRNTHLTQLQPQYLFPQIQQRKREFLEKNPGTQLISLGIGDTTEPIPESIVEGMKAAALRLGDRKTYTGYGPEQGHVELRT